MATALALAVVYPEAGNLGGGGFAVVRMGGDFAAFDFREIGAGPAPGTTCISTPRASRSRTPRWWVRSPPACPARPAGLYALQRRYGRLPWTRVVAPARRLAADGFRVGRHLHDLLDREETRKLLLPLPRERAGSGSPAAQPPAIGSLLRLPDLAATLGRYAEQGPQAITAGPVAAAVERASSARTAACSPPPTSPPTGPDWRQPLTFEAFGWKLVSMPLPSSGGVILGQTLGMLERLGWGKLPRFGADRDHLLTEALRRAFADRFLLGDPATTRATEAQLLAPDWIARRAAQIDPRHATPSAQVKAWPGAEAAPAGGSETTHLSVVDRDGNLVALTTTLNDLFGCGLWVPGAGFFLNDEMDDFATAPGQPNLFGLVQGEANAVAPGKRMLSSMAPVIAWKGSGGLRPRRARRLAHPHQRRSRCCSTCWSTATPSRPRSTARVCTTSGSPTAWRPSPTRSRPRPGPSSSGAATQILISTRNRQGPRRPPPPGRPGRGRLRPARHGDRRGGRAGDGEPCPTISGTASARLDSALSRRTRAACSDSRGDDPRNRIALAEALCAWPRPRRRRLAAQRARSSAAGPSGARPQTFSEQLAVREREILVEPPRRPRRQARLQPGDFQVLVDGQPREVTRAEPVSAGGRGAVDDPGLRRPGPGEPRHRLLLGGRARRACPGPGRAGHASRWPSPARPRAPCSRPPARPGRSSRRSPASPARRGSSATTPARLGAPPPSDLQVRRQLDKLLAFLAARHPAGPHVLFLVADGTDLTAAQAGPHRHPRRRPGRGGDRGHASPRRHLAASGGSWSPWRCVREAREPRSRRAARSTSSARAAATSGHTNGPPPAFHATRARRRRSPTRA